MPSNKKIILIIFLAFIVASVVAIKFLPNFPVISDSADYDQTALNIIKTKHYLPVADNIYYPPIYPFVLSTIYFIFGHNYLVVYLIHLIFLLIISFFTYKIAYIFFRLPPSLSTLATIAVLFWPYMLLFTKTLSTELLFIVFLIIYIFYLFKIITEKTNSRSHLLAGFIIGLGILTRPVALLLPIWLPLLLLILRKFKRLTTKSGLIKKLFISAGIAFITILPWSVIISLKTGYPTPITNQLTHVFKKGNSTLSYLSPEIDVSPKKWQDITKAKFKNIFLFWNPGAKGYNADAVIDKSPLIKPLIIIYQIIFYLILIGAFATLKYFKREPIIYLSWITILYFWLLHTALFPFPRYTLPLIPLLLILFSYTINHFIKKYENPTNDTGKK